MQILNDSILNLDQSFPNEENMSDPEFAFWDEFYREKNEEDTSQKSNLPLNPLKAN